MKRIIVCFKITDDYDALSVHDWSGSDDSGRPKTDFVRRILGCFDEAALENGLLLKVLLHQAREEAELIALTLNPGYSEHIIKRIAAVGYDRVIALQTKENLDFCPESTAGILAEEIENISDVYAVLTGARCAPGNTGVVPYLLAQRLGAEVYRDVTRFFGDADRIAVGVEYENGYAKERLKPGSVYVMNNTEKSFLRIPTLREKMKFRDFCCEKKEAERKTEDPKISFQTAVSERQCTFLEGEAAAAWVEAWKNEVLQ